MAIAADSNRLTNRKIPKIPSETISLTDRKGLTDHKNHYETKSLYETNSLRRQWSDALGPKELHALAAAPALLALYAVVAPPIWAAVAAASASSPWLRPVFGGVLALTLAGFWAHAALLAVLDLSGGPAALWRFKIQPARRASPRQYARAATNALANQLLLNVPLLALLDWYITVRCKRSPLDEHLPDVWSAAFHITVFAAIEEIGFYYVHRLLHHPLIYKHVHKKHHEFTSPIAMAATYAHPLEHFLSNLAPLAAGPLIMQSHVMLIWVWFSLAQFTAINSHCGYWFPGLPTPLAHDYHHQVFNANYGVLGVLDWLHGTRGNFFAWQDEWLAGNRAPDSGKPTE